MFQKLNPRASLRVTEKYRYRHCEERKRDGNPEKMKQVCITIILTFFSYCLYAQEIVLPVPSGPYCVGTKSFEINDPTRPEKNTWWGARKFMVQAYYPIVNTGSKNTPYMPETLEDGKIENITLYAHAELNAPIATKGPYPVIIMQPGLGGVRQAHTILCEDLASHGYVVFSLDHPYVASFVRFKDGSIITPHLFTMWRVNNNRDYRYAWFETDLQTSCQDIDLFLEKKLPQLNKSAFQSQLDLSKVGLMGHSFGGNVSLREGFKNPTIKAIIDVDSKLTERITLPENLRNKSVLFIRSNEYQDDVGDRLKYVLNAHIISFDVKHSAFEDVAYLAPTVPDQGNQSLLAKAWHFLAHKGPFIDHVGTGLGHYKKEEWFKIYTKTVKEFWDNHLLHINLR